jgi:quinoprotein glucose dehydrogenase
VRAARNDGMFTPPSTRPTIQVPGNNGGANYGMTAADEQRGRFFVISQEMPSILQLERVSEIRAAGANPFERGRNIYHAHCAACHGEDRAGAPGAPSLVGVHQRLNFEQVYGTST